MADFSDLLLVSDLVLHSEMAAERAVRAQDDSVGMLKEAIRRLEEEGKAKNARISQLKVEKISLETRVRYIQDVQVVALEDKINQLAKSVHPGGCWTWGDDGEEGEETPAEGPTTAQLQKLADKLADRYHLIDEETFKRALSIIEDSAPSVTEDCIEIDVTGIPKEGQRALYELVVGPLSIQGAPRREGRWIWSMDGYQAQPSLLVSRSQAAATPPASLASLPTELFHMITSFLETKSKKALCSTSFRLLSLTAPELYRQPLSRWEAIKFLRARLPKVLAANRIRPLLLPTTLSLRYNRHHKHVSASDILPKLSERGPLALPIVNFVVADTTSVKMAVAQWAPVLGHLDPTTFIVTASSIEEHRKLPSISRLSLVDLNFSNTWTRLKEVVAIGLGSVILLGGADIIGLGGCLERCRPLDQPPAASYVLETRVKGAEAVREEQVPRWTNLATMLGGGTTGRSRKPRGDEVECRLRMRA